MCFTGNHLLSGRYDLKGVIYVNAYSGKIICGALSLVIFNLAKRRARREIHTLWVRQHPCVPASMLPDLSSCYEPQMMRTVNHYFPLDSLPFCL